VEVGGDTIAKGELERFVARQREYQREEEDAAAYARIRRLPDGRLLKWLCLPSQ